MSEGFRRIAVAVRGLGYLVAALCAGSGIALAAINPDAWGQFVMLGVGSAALSAGSGWVLGWIIEGFSKP